MIVIGSTALKHHGFDVTPKDLDLVGTYEEVMNFKHKFGAVSYYPINSGASMYMRNARGDVCEIELAWEGSRAWKLIKFVQEQGGSAWRNIVDIHGNACHLPTTELLYMLKMSHRYLRDSPHFLKTMRDIQLLRSKGCEIPPSWNDFYQERMRDTYTYKHPNLKVNKGVFFDATMTGVVQKYDHDTMHIAVAHLDKPAYLYFKPEDEEVMCSREMFLACDRQIQLYSIVEEAMVLALERSLVPYPGKKTPKEAFTLALMKVCTSITSGWWREFAWENYDAALALYSDTYVERFNAGVANQTVKLKEN